MANTRESEADACVRCPHCQRWVYWELTALNDYTVAFELLSGPGTDAASVFEGTITAMEGDAYREVGSADAGVFVNERAWDDDEAPFPPEAGEVVLGGFKPGER